MKYGISSTRFAAYTSMYCEKLKYAQSMTKASDSLPRSWKWLGLSRLAIGACLARDVLATIVNASADNPWPPMKMNPNSVEYQCGLSDMIQSIAAAVAENA